eukprot:scaffold114_cov361-Pinguiococcus_pyrenoidosus.AAC.49
MTSATFKIQEESPAEMAAQSSSKEELPSAASTVNEAARVPDGKLDVDDPAHSVSGSTDQVLQTQTGSTMPAEQGSGTYSDQCGRRG